MNYQMMLDETINALGETKPRLLLHCCCAPCASYCVESLSRHFMLTLYYYNPNIMPREEYELRLSQFEKLRDYDFELVVPEYDEAAYRQVVKGLENEKEGGKRCTACFELRLEKTASYAAAEKYDYYGTTLTISPHKDAELINTLGSRIGTEAGVKWLYSDFKKRDGYKRSVELCSKLGIYRQSYCGCAFGMK